MGVDGAVRGGSSSHGGDEACDTAGKALVVGIGVVFGWGGIEASGGCDKGACDGGECGGCGCEGDGGDGADDQDRDVLVWGGMASMTVEVLIRETTQLKV